MTQPLPSLSSPAAVPWFAGEWGGGRHAFCAETPPAARVLVLAEEKGNAMSAPAKETPTPTTLPTTEREPPRKAPKPTKPRKVEKRQRGRKG